MVPQTKTREVAVTGLLVQRGDDIQFFNDVVSELRNASQRFDSIADPVVPAPETMLAPAPAPTPQ